MKLTATLAAVSLLCLSSAQAQITWDASQKEFHPTLKETESVAEFTFTNTGDRTVTILEVKPACGCTTAKLEKKTYAPGESGKVTGTFAFGKRQGLQLKTLTVKTNDPKSETTTLSLKVHLPKLLKMSPLFVWWKKGEEKTPKTISLEVLQDSPIKVLSVKSGNETLAPELETVEEGRQYAITVTPASTDEAVRTVLVIQTEFASGDQRAFHAFTHIR